MTNVIQQLIDNEKPFILMSEEMQTKLMQVAAKDIRCLQAVPGEVWVACGPKINWGSKPCRSTCTFRLRPGYKDEPGVVECEICLKKPGDYLYYVRRGVEERRLHRAFDDPDLAGFLYKPVFGEEIYPEPWLNLDVEQNGNYKMTHATHVLFRRKKQE